MSKTFKFNLSGKLKNRIFVFNQNYKCEREYCNHSNV
jgi:hypothetical protein